MKLIALATIVTLAAVSLAGCAGGDGDEDLWVGALDRLPSGLAGQTRAPDFEGANAWLNTADQPLSLDDLEGKVVLVDFWTYSCINCIRTFPHITSWYDTYAPHGLVVVGVHSPEFAFEEERDNVEDALERYGINYPVPQDNDRAIWNAYQNRFWPAHYLLDATGEVRAFHAGEGAYALTEKRIRVLLFEAGAKALPDPIEEGVADAQRGDQVTPELYAGYGRQAGTIGNGAYQPDQDVEHQAGPVSEQTAGLIYLDGTWHHGSEAVTARTAGTFALRFEAGAANFVADASGVTPGGAGCLPIRFDGGPVPTNLRGADVVADGAGTCVQTDGTPRSYDFYAGPVQEYRIEVDVPDGFSLYTFAFSRYAYGEVP